MDKKIAFATRAIILNEKNELLLLTKSDIEDVGANEYDIPGGRMEFGETPESSIVREVKEESGLDVEVVKLLELWAPVVKEDLQLVGVTFETKLLGGEVTLSSEHSNYRWIAINEFLSGDYPEWIKRSVKLLGEL